MIPGKSFFHRSDASEKRGSWRVRQAMITGITALISRALTVAAGFISVPLTANYLGSERFGVWLTVGTLLTWVSLTDFGLANSLTNALATADGKDNLQEAQEAVSSTVWLMLGIASFLGLGFSLIYPQIAWERVFNVTSTVAKTETSSVAIVAVGFLLLRLPLSIPNRIYSAYQEGYFYQLWSGCTSWLSIVALLLGIQFHASLPVLLVAFYVVFLLPDVISTIHLFGWHRPLLKPALHSFSWLKSQALLKLGIQFWLLQLSALSLFQTDFIIVAQLFGAKEVASYGVTFKLFSIIGIIQVAFLAPLWSAYNEALARNDHSWLVKIFKKTIQLTLLWSIGGGFCLLWLAPQLISAWVGAELVPDPSLLIAMFVVAGLTALAQAIAIFLNGLNEIAVQVIFGSISGIVNLLLSVILGRFLGLPGVTWATAICLGLFSVIIIGGDAMRQARLLQAASKAS